MLLLILLVYNLPSIGPIMVLVWIGGELLLAVQITALNKDVAESKKVNKSIPPQRHDLYHSSKQIL